MFTGIITDITEVLDSRHEAGGLTLVFRKPAGWDDLEIGESIATNGICLTVTAISDKDYTCHLVPETLRLSTYGAAVPAKVNLERPLRAGDRLGGHFVQGHGDTTGEVIEFTDGQERQLTVRFDPKYREFLVPKGSITINGVSLTVSGLTENSVTVALIPHTLESTTLQELQIGDSVNLEFDMISKQIAQIVGTHASR